MPACGCCRGGGRELAVSRQQRCLCGHRFMQLAPQYYFSNLPPSESKDLLQQATARLPAAQGEQPPCEKCPETTEQRCALQ